MEDEVRYVWLDEDGAEASPRHRKLHSAWDSMRNWNRYERAVLHESMGENHLKRLRQSLSKTGKAPVELVLLRISYEVEPLNADEANATELALRE